MGTASEVLYAGIMAAGLFCGAKGIDVYKRCPQEPDRLDYEYRAEYEQARIGYENKRDDYMMLFGAGGLGLLLGGAGFLIERKK